MKLFGVARTILFVTLVTLVTLATREARAGDDGFGRPGPYVGVGASRSVNLVEAYLDGTPVLEDIKVSDSWGVNTRLGYRPTSWLSVEAEYEWLHPFGVSIGGVHLGTLRAESATGNLRFILPISRVQPYLLLGAGAMFLSADTLLDVLTVDHSAFAGRLGLGLDVYLTRSLLVNVGAEAVLSPAEVRLETGTGTVSERGLGTVTFQAGLGYRF